MTTVKQHHADDKRHAGEKRHTIAELEAENAKLKRDLERCRARAIAFLSALAEHWSASRQLDGLHPVHYDLLNKFGVNMDAYKRANPNVDK